MSEQQIKKYHFLENEPKKRQFDIYDLAEYQKMYFEDSSKPHTHSFIKLFGLEIIVANILLILKAMI